MAGAGPLGRYYWNKRTPGNVKKAMLQFPIPALAKPLSPADFSP